MMLHLGKDDARRLISGAAYSYRNAIQNSAAIVPVQVGALSLVAQESVTVAELNDFRDSVHGTCDASTDTQTGQTFARAGRSGQAWSAARIFGTIDEVGRRRRSAGRTQR